MADLKDILGQSAAVSVLTSAAGADRLPHALLFAGPAGVGKGTTAAALGRLFLCERPKSGPPDSCGACASCKLMDGGTHPDYHVVYRQLIRALGKDSVARDISIHVIREFLLAPASRSTALGRGKIFVVEEAERMTTEAQNGLLKMLEEPPGRALMILLTETPGALLPTIRSRCQLVRFAPLSREFVERALSQRGVGAEAAAAAVGLSEGSLGAALRYVEDGLLPIAKELDQRITAALTGKSSGDLAKFLKVSGEALMEKQIERDPDGSKDQATRESLTLLFRLGSGTCRRYLRLARTGAGLEKLCAAIDHLTAAERNVDANVNVSLALQQLAAELEG